MQSQGVLFAGGSGLQYYRNVGDVVVDGFELESGMELARGLRAQLSFSYIDARLADVPKALAGKYQVVPPAGAPPGMRFPPAVITADSQGLLLALGPGGTGKFLPLSQSEFCDEHHPDAHVEFTRDTQGKVTGFTITGVGPEPMKAVRVP